MIDYTILGNSLKYYKKAGFQKVEVPWYVPEYIDKITNPCRSFKIDNNDDKCIVGSGEQGFLYMYSEGKLDKGMYQSITPCYRVEDVYDELHKVYFIKNELIMTNDVGYYALGYVIECAKNFFESYGIQTDIVKTSDSSYDIECDGIELGSYGIRNCEFLSWIYGTGCAEPRFTTVINKYK